MLDNYNNKTIVFFGDSITDSCKNNDTKYQFGAGYVNMLQADIKVFNPDLNINIYNEGISGNQTEDLLERFQKDVKSKNPNLVFLLIGINDVWHPLENNKIPDIDAIINRLSIIVTNIKELKSDIVLLSPFLFPTDAFFQSMKPYFDKYIMAFYDFVKNNNLKLIDTYKIMQSANNFALTKDSVHPTIYGHAIIAQAIMDYLNK